jgi:hypothetical protein
MQTIEFSTTDLSPVEPIRFHGFICGEHNITFLVKLAQALMPPGTMVSAKRDGVRIEMSVSTILVPVLLGSNLTTYFLISFSQFRRTGQGKR